MGILSAAAAVAFMAEQQRISLLGCATDRPPEGTERRRGDTAAATAFTPW
jgi:hypothetical protein